MVIDAKAGSSLQDPAFVLSVGSEAQLRQIMPIWAEKEAMMAMRTPPPIMPSPEEARLLDWLRATAQRDNIPPWTLVPALLDTLQTIDAGRGKKLLHNKLAELAAMGSPQRQARLRIIFAVTALVGFIILCCLFSYVAGTLIVVTNQHPLPTPTVPR